MKWQWTMRDRLTGEVKTGTTDMCSEFAWLEGNFACDHNRASEFHGSDSEVDDCASMPDSSYRFVLLRLVNEHGGVEFDGEDPEGPDYCF